MNSRNDEKNAVLASQARKSYESPKLEVHGDLKEITKKVAGNSIHDNPGQSNKT